MLDKVDALFARLEDVMAFQAIRQGLILTIPVLLVGSFCLIFLNLPLAPYQDALAGAPRVEGLLDLVYDGTMGIFSLYVSVAVALRYANACAERFGGFFVQGAPFAALAAYLMSVGFGTEGFDPIVLSTRSLFIAIVCGLASSVLYCRLVRLRRTRRLYGDSLDNVFNQAVSGLLPIAAVIALFGAANAAVAALSGSSCIEQLFFDSVSALFPLATATLGSGLLYLFLNNVMWFFGIHGGNMLDSVAQSVFVPGTAANAAALAAGGEPVQIVTKTFLDVFASIGGAGALLSLLAAILLFGRRRSGASRRSQPCPCASTSPRSCCSGCRWCGTRRCSCRSSVPLVNMVVAYGAMAVGLVPPVVVDVSWTTRSPGGGLLRGYRARPPEPCCSSCASRSARCCTCRSCAATSGWPTITRGCSTKRCSHRSRTTSAGRSVELVAAGRGSLGAVARSLAEDVGRRGRRGLRAALPAAVRCRRRAVGAEALLRMEHPCTAGSTRRS